MPTIEYSNWSSQDANSIDLTAPSDGVVSLYVVNIQPYDNSWDSQPIIQPDFTFAEGVGEWWSFGASTWGSPYYVLMVIGGPTIPGLSWEWDPDGVAFDVQVLIATVSEGYCSFQPQTLFGGTNRTIRAQDGSVAAVHGYMMSGVDGSNPSTAPPMSAFVNELPYDANLGFFEYNGTPVVGMAELAIGMDLLLPVRWSGSGVLGPYVGWGGTLSIFDPVIGEPGTSGWTLGMRAG